MKNIETILGEVKRHGEARNDYCAKVRDFAQQIINACDGTSCPLGQGFHVREIRSNVGSETYLINQDGKVLNMCRAGGGGKYLHGDFNAWIEYANYKEGLAFVDHMSTAFSDYAAACVDQIEMKTSFFR